MCNYGKFVCKHTTNKNGLWYQNGSFLKVIFSCTFRDTVCVCVFIREGFFRLQDVQDILESTDQQTCVVNIS